MEANRAPVTARTSGMNIRLLDFAGLLLGGGDLRSRIGPQRHGLWREPKPGHSGMDAFASLPKTSRWLEPLERVIGVLLAAAPQPAWGGWPLSLPAHRKGFA